MTLDFTGIPWDIRGVVTLTAKREKYAEWPRSVRLRSRVVPPREPHSTGVTGEALKVMLEVGSDAIFAVWYFQEYLWDLSQWLKCQITHHGASIRSKMFTGKLDDIVPESHFCYAFDWHYERPHQWASQMKSYNTLEKDFRDRAVKLFHWLVGTGIQSALMHDSSLWFSRKLHLYRPIDVDFSVARRHLSLASHVQRSQDSGKQQDDADDEACRLPLSWRVHFSCSPCPFCWNSQCQQIPTALKSQAPASPASPACCSSTQQHHFSSLFSIGSSTVTTVTILDHDPPQIPSPTASCGRAFTWQVPKSDADQQNGSVVTIEDILCDY